MSNIALAKQTTMKPAIPLKHHRFKKMIEGRLILDGSYNHSFNISIDTLISRDLLLTFKTSQKYVSEILVVSFVIRKSIWERTKSSFSKSKKPSLNIRFALRNALLQSNPGLDPTKLKIDECEYYEFFDLSNFNREEQDIGNGHIKITLFKKSEIFAKDSSEETDEEEDLENFEIDSNPLFIIKGDEISTLSKKVDLYNLIRKSTTTAMLGDFSKPLTLAAQINNLSYYNEDKFIVTKEMAEKFIYLFNNENGYEQTFEVESEVLDSVREIEAYSDARKLLTWFYEWVEYFFFKFIQNSMLKPTNNIVTRDHFNIFELIVDNDFIRNTLSEGLNNGAISFTEKTSGFSYIEKFDDFMYHNSDLMVNMIKSLVKEVHVYNDIPWFVKNIIKKVTTREPLEKQLNLITAAVKALNLKNRVQVYGEPGVGKTLMTILTTLIHSINRGIAAKVAVVCPDTLVYATWLEELLMTYVDAKENINIHIIKSTEELMDLEARGIFDDDQHQFVIISQSSLKSEFNLKPSVVWSKVKDGFTCPCCGELQTRKILNPDHKDDERLPKYIDVPKHFSAFSSHTTANSNCQKCDEPLWSPINKSNTDSDKFFYLPKSTKTKNQVHGFFPIVTEPFEAEIRLERYRLSTGHYDSSVKATNKAKRLIDEYISIIEMINKNELPKMKISKQTASIASYVEKKLRHKFTHLILDEAHEYQNMSKRTNAVSKMIKSIRFVLTATGTSMNGYPKSRFLMDFMLFPQKLLQHGFRHSDVDKYQKTFGVTEETKRYRLVDGKEKKLTPVVKDKPGISPIIFALFMQDTCLFLEVKDISDNLPPLTYEQIEVPMNSELKEAQKEFTSKLKELAQEDKIDFVSALTTNISFLDMPQKSHKIYDHIDKSLVYSSTPIHSSADAKLTALKEFLRNEIFVQNRKVLIYTQWTGDGINDYLLNDLQNEFRISGMNKANEYSFSVDGTKQKVKKDARLDFVRSEMTKGTDILLVSPELVKTGFNLTMFPTIVYYQLGFQVYTLRQADKRAWRLGQTQDCKIVYLYYKDTFQNDVASIMSTKIVASQAIEGKMDAAGLEAILNERTPEEELQKRFYEGLRDKNK